MELSIALKLDMDYLHHRAAKLRLQELRAIALNEAAGA